MSCRRHSAPAALLLASLLASPPPARAAGLQDQLNANWRGAPAVLLLETTSDCDGSYTNNKVLGTRVVSAALHRLPTGELGRIAKVDLKRSRIDILIDIDEPLLVSWTDGPYQLYEQALCRVELEIEVARDLVKSKRLDEIESLLSRVLERHDDQESVARSERWNRRVTESTPEGYDEILDEYRAWSATRLRAALVATLDDALTAALRVIDGADDDAAYGAGLAAGIKMEASRYRSWDECEELVGESFYPVGRDAPSEYEGGDERQWERGYRDGQVVAFNAELSRRIGRCLEGS